MSDYGERKKWANKPVNNRGIKLNIQGANSAFSSGIPSLGQTYYQTRIVWKNAAFLAGFLYPSNACWSIFRMNLQNQFQEFEAYSYAFPD